MGDPREENVQFTLCKVNKLGLETCYFHLSVYHMLLLRAFTVKSLQCGPK